jgi:hypothetical protein
MLTAYDGKAFSNHAEIHVNVSAVTNHAPVLTAPSANVSATAGQSIAASSLFSGTDADGDALTYYLYNSTTAGNSGHFSVNGTTVQNGTIYAVSEAQLALTTFVAGSMGANDDLVLTAYDGKAFSNHVEFHILV